MSNQAMSMLGQFSKGANPIGQFVMPLISEIYNWDKVREQRRYNESQVDKQWQRQLDQWNRENAYNDPRQVIARMKGADVNPALAFMNGASFAPAAASPSPGANKGQPVPIDPLTASNIELAHAQAEDLRESAANKRQDREDKGIDLEVKKALHSEGLLESFKRSEFNSQFHKEGVDYSTALTTMYDFLVYTGQFTVEDGQISYQLKYGEDPSQWLYIPDTAVTKKRRENMIGTENERAAVISATIEAQKTLEEYERKHRLQIRSDDQFERFLMDNKDKWWSVLIRGARWLFNTMPSMHLPNLSFSRSQSHSVDYSTRDTKIFNSQK